MFHIILLSLYSMAVMHLYYSVEWNRCVCYYALQRIFCVWLCTSNACSHKSKYLSQRKKMLWKKNFIQAIIKRKQ